MLVLVLGAALLLLAARGLWRVSMRRTPPSPGLQQSTANAVLMFARYFGEVQGWRIILALVSLSEAVMLAMTGYRRLSSEADLFEDWGYGVVRWTILIVGSYGIASALRVKSKHLLVWVSGIVLIFNPLRRPYLQANEWGSLDILAACIFVWVAMVQLWRSRYPDRSAWA